jgi:hypothetical protein
VALSVIVATLTAQRALLAIQATPDNHELKEFSDRVEAYEKLRENTSSPLLELTPSVAAIQLENDVNFCRV